MIENLEPVGLFDPRAVFPLKDTERIKKSCDLRFPTDDEWRARQRKIRSIQIPAGPQQSRTETQGYDEANLDLFNTIRQDKEGEAFDEAEASRMIESLTRCNVLEAGLVDDKFVCRLLLLAGVEVVHILRIPSEKQIRTYQRAVLDTVTKGRRGQVETRLNLGAGERLYDDAKAEARGYADGAAVPLDHKATVATELVLSLEELEVSDPFVTGARKL